MHNVPLTARQRKDIRLLATFTEAWCAGHRHLARKPFQIESEDKQFLLCEECRQFLAYAEERRLRCPIEVEKPSCKHCRIHCYAPQQRELVKKIMAWSGRRLILRGRLDYLWHYFF